MAGYLIVGTLAAFGLFSVLWALFGWLLPGGKGGWLLYPGKPGEGELSFVRRYLWLKGIGLLNCPLIVADLGLSCRERQWLRDMGIELCSLEELSERLGIGAEMN